MHGGEGGGRRPGAGLHARLVARFVREAKGYGSEILVIEDGKQGNAKSSLALMTLGAKHGDRFVIRAEGYNEEAAAETLVAVLPQEEEE